MGHILVSSMLKIRKALDALVPSQHGVDGKAVYLYGEAWDFGEMAGNMRGRNACQLNITGTGIGECPPLFSIKLYRPLRPRIARIFYQHSGLLNRVSGAIMFCLSSHQVICML